MRDTIISAAVKRRELKVLLGCFVVANIANIFAIVKYATPWYEILTQMGYVVIITALIYALLSILRVAWWFIKGLKSK